MIVSAENVNQRFRIGLLKALFLATPGILHMIYLIYQFQVHLKQNFSFHVPLRPRIF